MFESLRWGVGWECEIVYAHRFVNSILRGTQIVISYFVSFFFFFTSVTPFSWEWTEIVTAMWDVVQGSNCSNYPINILCVTVGFRCPWFFRQLFFILSVCRLFVRATFRFLPRWLLQGRAVMTGWICRVLGFGSFLKIEFQRRWLYFLLGGVAPL